MYINKIKSILTPIQISQRLVFNMLNAGEQNTVKMKLVLEYLNSEEGSFLNKTLIRIMSEFYRNHVIRAAMNYHNHENANEITKLISDYARVGMR